MNSRQMIERLNASTGIGLGKSKEVIKALFDIITEELAVGNDVKVNKFGTFNIKTREARVGYNIQTGESMEIPAKKKVSFKPSIGLKTLIEENN
ncbi:HU family DNA-binding protein [Anaerovoracaceae bacterium 41-7]